MEMQLDTLGSQYNWMWYTMEFKKNKKHIFKNGYK